MIVPRRRARKMNPDQLNVIEMPSVKFDVLVGFLSRYQVWKCQVSPG